MMESIDKLLLLRGDDIYITEDITLRQPSINQIADYGEEQFFSVFYSLCSIPSDLKSVLWDAGIDFMEISDWALFLMMSKNFSVEQTQIVFGDIDFSSGQLMKIRDTEEVVLQCGNVVIRESDYLSFIPYVREMIGYVMKREKAGNKFTKQILIDEDRRKRQEAKKEYQSLLYNIILSLVNTEEFSYTYKTAYETTPYQLFKSYYQIQNKKSACALYQGSMSGFVDTSKINKSSFSWLYDENKFV